MNRSDQPKIKEVSESEPEIKVEDVKTFVNRFIKLSRKRQIDYLRTSVDPTTLRLICELAQNSLENNLLSPRAVSPRPTNDLDKECNSGLNESKTHTTPVKPILALKRDMEPICSLQDLIRAEERFALIQSNLAESAVEQTVDPSDLERPKSRQRFLFE